MFISSKFIITPHANAPFCWKTATYTASLGLIDSTDQAAASGSLSSASIWRRAAFCSCSAACQSCPSACKGLPISTFSSLRCGHHRSAHSKERVPIRVTGSRGMSDRAAVRNAPNLNDSSPASRRNALRTSARTHARPATDRRRGSGSNRSSLPAPCRRSRRG